MSDEALLMARLTNDALNMHLRPQPVYEIVSEAAARYRDEREIRVSESSELVMGDRPYLARVFDNLLSNAVKYSSAPSPIDVTIERRGRNDIEIAVSDRGAGIAAADIPHVFQEFWRAQGTSERSGSGIGLFIVRKIVEAHGGTATIESSPGKGTTVRVVLPAAAPSSSDVISSWRRFESDRTEESIQ